MLPFPANSSELYGLPAYPGPEGLSSVDTLSAWVKVPKNDYATDEPFHPIAAVKIVAYKTCKANRRECPPLWNAAWNDGMARISVWLTAITVPDAGGDPNVLPPHLDFQLRVSKLCIPQVVADGRIVPADMNAQGLIAQTTGLLGDQVELWASLSEHGPSLVSEVRVAFMIDRLGGDFEVVFGDPLVIAGIPLVL